MSSTFADQLMELKVGLDSTLEFLCEISHEPSVALLLIIMLQERPTVRLPAARGVQGPPIVQVDFKCFGLMSIMSFTSDPIMTSRSVKISDQKSTFLI